MQGFCRETRTSLLYIPSSLLPHSFRRKAAYFRHFTLYCNCFISFPYPPFPLSFSLPHSPLLVILPFRCKDFAERAASYWLPVQGLRRIPTVEIIFVHFHSTDKAIITFSQGEKCCPPMSPFDSSKANYGARIKCHILFVLWHSIGTHTMVVAYQRQIHGCMLVGRNQLRFVAYRLSLTEQLTSAYSGKLTP
jgi:hypothetical protein